MLLCLCFIFWIVFPQSKKEYFFYLGPLKNFEILQSYYLFRGNPKRSVFLLIARSQNKDYALQNFLSFFC